jgi:hypothetical protein
MKAAIRVAYLSVLLLLVLFPVPLAAESPAPLGFVKGISWGWVGSRGDFASPEAADSMEKLADTGADDTGAEWVCIAFAANMKSPHDPEFAWGDDNPSMVTDDEIRHAIDLARENNLKVILKPVVNCADGTWRAWIRFYRPITEEEKATGVTGEMDPWGDMPHMREGEVTDLEAWDKWWSNYSSFLLHYAQIAQEKNVDLFCLGCEMNSTEQFLDEWRELIADVRDVYKGPVTYDTNHGREAGLTWWEAVDIISVSAYYDVPAPEGTSIEEAAHSTTSQAEIERRLEGIKGELAAISSKYQKPILFIETGVTNVRGCARYPWSHPGEHMDSPLDETEQANYYRAFFKVFWNEPWFMGFAWWDWPSRLYERDFAAENRGFCIYGKEAEAVVREWYAKPRTSP